MVGRTLHLPESGLLILEGHLPTTLVAWHPGIPNPVACATRGARGAPCHSLRPGGRVKGTSCGAVGPLSTPPPVLPDSHGAHSFHKHASPGARLPLPPCHPGGF